jgi:hypothetical protein
LSPPTLGWYLASEIALKSGDMFRGFGFRYSDLRFIRVRLSV